MTPRPNTYITDLRHYLDEGTGELAEMPTPALKLAMFLASIVAWTTVTERDGPELTNVWCWRRPRRAPCRGEVVAGFADGTSAIVWQCPLCGVNGEIRGWEDSQWDLRMQAA